jgi:hypothetical protein
MKRENYIRIQNRTGMSNHEFLDSIHGFYYGVAVALILIILLASISSCSVNDNKIESGIGKEYIYPAGNQSGFETTGLDPFLANYPDMAQSSTILYSLAGNIMTEHCEETDYLKESGFQTSRYYLGEILWS